MVRFVPERAPATQDWNEATQGAGFELHLDPSCEIQNQSGFWPCVYRDDEAGFEFYAEVIDKKADAKFRMELEGLEPETDGRDFRATFSAGSDEEVASAVIAAAILAELTNGLVYDTWSGEEIAAGQARAWAKKSTTKVSPEDERAKFLAKRLAKKGRT